MWNAKERPIMRYATISVMGTSLFTGTWFGNAVQWVGMVYADAIRELAPYDPTFPWEKVANGILISAMQQQKTAASPCKHVGFFPDSYTPVKGDEAYHWCVSPQAIGHLVDALHGLDARASSVIVRAGDRTVHIVSAGRVTDAAFEDGTLRFTAHYLPGEPHEIVITRVADVAAVTVDGAALLPNELKLPTDIGRQTTPFGFLRLRVRSESSDAHVELRGCTLMAPETAMDLNTIQNGDFEAGLLYWAPDHIERAHIVTDAHGETNALELDALGVTDEVDCSSRPMRVEAGRAYDLTAWVKTTGGEGDYKVTICWNGATQAHVYANDWQGTNRPAQYTLHGGRFVAPPGARSAVIILGARAGSRYVFDDVSLKPVTRQ
jgi:hypothetical protein